MEDDKLKDLFSNYEPDLSSSFQFMTKLKKNMGAVEIVSQYQVAQKRLNRWAVAIAGMSGFAVGVVMTLLFPFITEWIASFNFNIPLTHTSALTFDFKYLTWLIVAAISVLTSVSVYNVVNSQSSVLMSHEQWH